MKFDTKLAVIVRDDLETWQKLNVTAFTVSGIAGTVEGIVGEHYEDASGNTYLPMFRQPVLVFAASSEQMRTIYSRARSRDIRFTLYTEDLFQTNNDGDNRAMVRARTEEELPIVGMALWAEKKQVDKVLKGIPLHS